MRGFIDARFHAVDLLQLGLKATVSGGGKVPVALAVPAVLLGGIGPVMRWHVDSTDLAGSAGAAQVKDAGTAIVVQRASSSLRLSSVGPSKKLLYRLTNFICKAERFSMRGPSHR